MEAEPAADPIPVGPNAAPDPATPVATVGPPTTLEAFADIGGRGLVKTGLAVGMLAVALAMDSMTWLAEENISGPIERVAVGMMGLGSNGAMVRQ